MKSPTGVNLRLSCCRICRADRRLALRLPGLRVGRARFDRKRARRAPGGAPHVGLPAGRDRRGRGAPVAAAVPGARRAVGRRVSRTRRSIPRRDAGSQLRSAFRLIGADSSGFPGRSSGTAPATARRFNGRATD